MKQTVRIATRKSPLALWQANFVRTHLKRHHPNIEVELHAMMTTGDKLFATPLNEIGGKGLFVKELERAILEHKADIAVHSIKDMPTELADGLELAVVCKRDDARDAFVSNHYETLLALPKGAILGTSSLRRQAQILALRPDLVVYPLRGNVGTRLSKLDRGEFDAIILAAAGLQRLEMSSRIRSYLPLDIMLPASGQGAIGIECRYKDKSILDLISFLKDLNTHYAITSERVLSRKLGGSCQLPLAAHAKVEGDKLYLKALVGEVQGRRILRTDKFGPKEKAEGIGIEAAEDLMRQGASALLGK
jgi:hydroxymethylbilane synthase